MIRSMLIFVLMLTVIGCNKPNAVSSIEPIAPAKAVPIQRVELTKTAATQIRKIQRESGDPLYVEVSLDANSEFKLDLVDMIDAQKHIRSETQGLPVAVTHEAMAAIDTKLMIEFVNDEQGQRFKISEE